MIFRPMFKRFFVFWHDSAIGPNQTSFDSQNEITVFLLLKETIPLPLSHSSKNYGGGGGKLGGRAKWEGESKHIFIYFRTNRHI